MKKKEEEGLYQECEKSHGRSRKYLKSLPQCWSCGIVCGADFLVEKEADVFVFKETGKEIILCGGCRENLETKNGHLRPERKGRNGKEIEVRKEELIRK